MPESAEQTTNFEDT